MYTVSPASCGKIYMGETTKRLEQSVKEHQDPCRRDDKKVSAIGNSLTPVNRKR